MDRAATRSDRLSLNVARVVSTKLRLASRNEGAACGSERAASHSEGTVSRHERAASHSESTTSRS